MIIRILKKSFLISGVMAIVWFLKWWLLIPGVILAFILWRLNGNLNFVINRFSAGNVIAFGAKGKGKDMLFQNVIRKKQKHQPYVANMPYGYAMDRIITFNDLTVAPNTFEDLIDGKYHKIPPAFEWDTDAFMSDAGIFLPSHFDGILSKKYPSLPILYALSRQLYRMNIHLNSQALNRIWIKIREQADSYFKALVVVSVPGFIFQKVRYFEHYESANRNVLPFKHKIMNKENNALADQFTATNGKILDMWLMIPKKKIKYDTYWFRKMLIIENYEKQEEQEQQKTDNALVQS